MLTVSADGMLREFETSTFSFNDITNLAPLMAKRGEISSIAIDRDSNLYIAFRIRGAVRADKSTGYRPVDLGIKVGVFSLLASDNQDVVWIGSDCGGVFTCFNAPYDISTLSYAQLDGLISNPVRSVYLDNDRTLWLGTKGSGLLQVADFDTHTASHGSMQLHTTANSSLHHNSVFVITQPEGSRHIWLGTEEGINVYDYHTQKISKVPTDFNMKWIHGIYIQGDSILWAASIGQGVFKSRIDNSGEVPRLHSTRQYLVGDHSFSNNYFFSLSADSDGKPVFANRGMGAYTYDEANDLLRRICLRGEYDSPSINDVFSVIKEKDAIWLGTGNGLIKQTLRDERLYDGPEDGLVNNTVHALLRDPAGDMWISTNHGLINFNTETEQTRLFDSNNGVSVIEYSDGASYASGDSVLIFSGVDGVAFIHPRDVSVKKRDLSVRLIGLSINGRSESYTKYFDSESNMLTFLPYQNYITLLFSSPEFINTNSSYYLYSLDGREWNENATGNAISFTNLNPGKHSLYVKSANRELHAESAPMKLTLYVTPRWYESTAAKVIYALIIIGIILAIIYLIQRRQRDKQQGELKVMQQKHKEELYEEKLRFFTNITHEFCTPITLIQGPCERILSYENADDYVCRYTKLIYNNSRRLNNLIQEIIDLRRIETGHSPRKVRHIDVSELCNDTIDTFAELSDRTGITVDNQVEPDIAWNTDYNSISKIVTNLISNAFKYTPAGGTIRVSLAKNGDMLRLEVWNTGKGIPPEDRERIFNCYAILDNIEEKVVHGISARNGLGMAICHSMVEQLEGNISIESEVDRYASFIVTLPMLQLDAPAEHIDAPIACKQPNHCDTKPEIEGKVTDGVTHADDMELPSLMLPSGSHRLLIVDDNVEILSLLKDSLSEYDVDTATNGNEAIELLTKKVYDLIITDVMMPGTDGLELSRQIKANRHTAHIPLIILSAKTSNDEMIQGIESGADMYIRKPFSFGYLRAVIVRLIERSSQLKEYYNSSGSAYQYEGGQLISREGKTFIDNLTAYIDANIDDPDLSIESLANNMNMSVRNLYRKLKELVMASPNDLIKSYRLTSAARLLRTTSLTVQEIMFRVGFSNRSHFYREFAKKYNTTPKEYRMNNQTRDESLCSSDGE